MTGLSSIEEIDDIDLLLHNVPGILGIEGDEKSITITYDPAVITVDQLQQQMEAIGYPVKPPES
jgi:copper chaperone CopZ